MGRYQTIFEFDFRLHFHMFGIKVHVFRDVKNAIDPGKPVVIDAAPITGQISPLITRVNARIDPYFSPLFSLCLGPNLIGFAQNEINDIGGVADIDGSVFNGELFTWGKGIP